MFVHYKKSIPTDEKTLVLVESEGTGAGGMCFGRGGEMKPQLRFAFRREQGQYMHCIEN